MRLFLEQLPFYEELSVQTKRVPMMRLHQSSVQALKVKCLGQEHKQSQASHPTPTPTRLSRLEPRPLHPESMPAH